MSALAAALLLADGRTPSGSYAHSAGVEAAVREGLRTNGVPAFLRARLRTVAFTEAAITAAATGAAEDPVALDRLDAETRARTPSPPLRAASATLGRSLLRTGAQLYPEAAALHAYRGRSTSTPRAVALGVVAHAAGLDGRDAALVALHEDAASVAAAAVKLLPLDAGDASGWVAALAGELGELAVRAAGAATAAAGDPADLPSLGVPLVELRSLTHGHDQGRLFAS